MKLDAHQHFWQYNSTDYGWIDDSMLILKQDFLPTNLAAEIKAFGFDGSIAVQARQTYTETDWLLALASQYEFIKGVVGWVDLCNSEIDEVLAKYASNPKLVGVRHVVHDEPDDRFMARPDFQHGLSLLEKYGLTYDLLIFPKHLPLATELVKKFPNQRFVLDHMAKPDIKNQLKEPWTTQIKLLAEQPNVYCKLSGMVTEADWAGWKTADFAYYLDVVFDAFGPDRLMVGSDWPVCQVAASYQKTLSIVIDYLEKFDETNKLKLLGDNCFRFYL
jgi:L-fuconolactonase